MKIDQQTVKKMAHLARLEFDEAGENDMIQSMSEILDWVDQLKEVDTEDVAPLTSMTLEVNNWREDEVMPPLSRERGLSQVPKKDDEHIRVPKVIE
jgi:aspartyl-tRNA(Asn)/glutamyl-tRNA(Gln) amidotransferase subunit C